jgi:hypothetical protein
LQVPEKRILRDIFGSMMSTNNVTTNIGVKKTARQLEQIQEIRWRRCERAWAIILTLMAQCRTAEITAGWKTFHMKSFIICIP